MVTAYGRGASFERRVMAAFDAVGYWTMRSSISRGSADFIALDMVGPDKRPLLVQCKRTRAAIEPRAWNRLYDVAEATRSHPMVAVAVFTDERVTGIEVYRISGHKTAETAGHTSRTPWNRWALRSAEEASALELEAQQAENAASRNRLGLGS